MSSGFTVEESFIDHFSSFIPLTGFMELSRSQMVQCVLSTDLLKFILSMLDGEEALLDEDLCLFWNPDINKRSEGEDQGMRDMGVARYSFICEPAADVSYG